MEPVPQTAAVTSVEPEAEAESDEAVAHDSVAMPANLQEDITASPDKKPDAKKAKKPKVAKKLEVIVPVVQQAVADGKILFNNCFNTSFLTFKSVEEDIYPVKTFQFL